MAHETLNSLESADNIYRLAEELRIPERNIIDFSIPVNPLGVSKKVKAELRKCLKYLDQYPDPESKRLIQSLARYHGITPECILCGNGRTDLIYLIARALKPQRVLITGPAYPVYEDVLLMNVDGQYSEEAAAVSQRHEMDIRYLMLNEAEGLALHADTFIAEMRRENIPAVPSLHTRPPYDMIFLCNPNDLTGKVVRREDMEKILRAAEELKCYLVVDESLIDFCPEHSVISEVVSHRHLIVLRTMTYFFALAGLRIGYGAFPSDAIRKLKACQIPRSTNMLAQRAPMVAIKDKAYHKETVRIIQQGKKFLEKHFRMLGIDFIRSEGNMILLRLNNAVELSRALKRKGILVRDCSHIRGLNHTYLHIAVKSHKENLLLVKGIASFLEKQGQV
jgi:threonine-phosphate decarboxylase